MDEMYISGWNARVANANAKLPRRCPANESYIRGFWDCDTAFAEAIADSILTGTNPVYPTAKQGA